MLRYILFLVLVLAGCSEQQLLVRMSDSITSKPDADEFNMKNRDYSCYIYSVFASPDTSLIANKVPAYLTDSKLSDLTIGQTYQEPNTRHIYKVISRRSTTLYQGIMVAFSRQSMSKTEANRNKEYYTKQLAEGAIEVFDNEPGYCPLMMGSGMEYFPSNGENNELIELLRTHKDGDIFTYDETDGSGGTIYRVIKKIGEDFPVTETIVAEIRYRFGSTGPL